MNIAVLIKGVVCIGAVAQVGLSILSVSNGAPAYYLWLSGLMLVAINLCIVAAPKRGAGSLFVDMLWLGLVWGYLVKFHIAYNAEWLAREYTLPLIEASILRYEGADKLYLVLSSVVLVCGPLLVVASSAIKSLNVDSRPHFPRGPLRLRLYIMAGCCLAVSVFTSYLTVKYGIAIGGAGENLVQLPFRLAGVIYWTRALALPVLLSLGIWCAMIERQRLAVRALAFVCIFHGVTMAFANSSRGAIIYALMPTAFVIAFNSRIKATHIWMMAAAVISAGMLHPLFTEVRNIRINHDVDLRDAAELAVQKHIAGEPQSEGSFSKAVSTVIGRYVGAEGALFAFSQPVGLDLRENYARMFSKGALEFSRIFTAEFAGYGYATDYYGAAPSLLGSYYILGGFVGPALFGALSVLAIVFLVVIVAKVAGPIALPVVANISMFTFMELGEGMIVSLAERLALTLFVCFAASRYFRFGRIRSSLVEAKPIKSYR